MMHNLPYNKGCPFMMGLAKIISYPTILVGCTMMVILLEVSFIFGATYNEKIKMIIHN